MSKISDNGKKKSGRTKTIDPNDILAIYHKIMPLIYNNPEGLDVADQINKQLLSFVKYDFYHYLMETPSPDHFYGMLDLAFEKWERFGPTSQDISLHRTSGADADETFKKHVQRNYQHTIERGNAKYPDIQSFYYHRIESFEYPKIVIGFFRVNKEFASQELALLDKMAPDIILLYRAVLNQVFHSQTFQYFESFTRLGSKLAHDHNLSDSEVKLIPDILFGYSNEEIAERHFVSVATVKTHINHILKKTGTKKRVDFITKFFTSPENIQL